MFVTNILLQIWHLKGQRLYLIHSGPCACWCWTFCQMNSLGSTLLAVWILAKLYPGILQSCNIKTWNLVILHSSHSSKFPSCKLTIMQRDSTANFPSWNLPILHSNDLERLSCKKLSWNQVWIIRATHRAKTSSKFWWNKGQKLVEQFCRDPYLPTWV